jgi:hypothetical protein
MNKLPVGILQMMTSIHRAHVGIAFKNRYTNFPAASTGFEFCEIFIP